MHNGNYKLEVTVPLGSHFFSIKQFHILEIKGFPASLYSICLSFNLKY